jgi:hypothetical protein
MKTDTLPAEVKSYVDYAVAAAILRGQTQLSVAANHAFSTNSANVAINNTATPIVQVTGLVQRGTGKYRVYGMANYTNPGAVTHSVQLTIYTSMGSAAASAVYAGASVALISGGDGGYNGLYYELTSAQALTGASSAIILEGVGDVSCSCSVLANGATLVVQEIF